MPARSPWSSIAEPSVLRHQPRSPRSGCGGCRTPRPAWLGSVSSRVEVRDLLAIELGHVRMQRAADVARARADCRELILPRLRALSIVRHRAGVRHRSLSRIDGRGGSRSLAEDAPSLAELLRRAPRPAAVGLGAYTPRKACEQRPGPSAGLEAVEHDASSRSRGGWSAVARRCPCCGPPRSRNGPCRS